MTSPPLVAIISVTGRSGRIARTHGIIRKGIPMARLLIVSFAAIVLLSAAAFAEEPDANAILQKAVAAYKSMRTYKAEGTITSDVEAGGRKMVMQTSFSMLLKKPNLYLVTWTQKDMPMPGMTQAGAVWSDGTQPYFYMSVLKAYSKMESDEMALGAGAGISGGATVAVPPLFFPLLKGLSTPFSRLIDPKLEADEKVDGEDCYVIGGVSTVSKKETFWISKSKHMIVKYSRSLEIPEGNEEFEEAARQQLEEALKEAEAKLEKALNGTGKTVSEEQRKTLRETLVKNMDAAKLRGYSTELYVKITSPKAEAKDFQFSPPEGTVLKDNLFGGNE